MTDKELPQAADAKNWLAAIVSSSDDVIISKNLDGIILTWNRAAQKVFGYTGDEAIGKHISLIIPNDRIDEEYLILGKVRNGESIDHFETVRRTKDGRLLDISLTVSPIIDDEGRIVGVSKIARDISAAKAAQRAAAHLAAIVDSSDDAIISKALDGTITSWNQAAERLFGYTADEAIGQHISLLIPPNCLSEEASIIGKIRANERLEHYETVRRTKSGDIVDVSLTVSPILDQNGNVAGASKIARNISEQKRTQVLLAEAGRRREEFMANMSHELRTPMNAIIGLGHVVSMSEGLRPRDREAMAMLRSSADSLLKLINDLLDFSKIDRGQIDIEEQEFDLCETANSVVKLLDVKAREKALSLDYHYEPELGDLYRGDAFRIQQILTNLIGNAIKFTELGRVRVRVMRGAAVSDVVFEVSDTGIGIPLAKQTTIFDKFTQADSSMTRRYGGTGLGLSITQALVDRLGGRIELISTPGMGSTFTVTLPLVRAPANPASAAPSVQRNTRNILVVDDYPANAVVMGSIAEHLGYGYDVAVNGMEAIKRVGETAYDIVLMDVQMPGMDGFEATRRIRQLELEKGFPAVAIVAVTAHVRSSDRQQCLDAGMVDFIPKPFHPEQMGAFLKQFVPAGSRSAEADGTGAPIIHFSDHHVPRSRA